MNLYDKINSLYDSLTNEDWIKYICLRNDMQTPPNGKVKVGNDYIDSWSHPKLAQPTQAQIDAIGD